MKLFAALDDDSQQGWVWLKKPELLPRGIVRITCGDRSVFCEALQIEDNFLKKYNREGEGRIFITNAAETLVINGWYRAKLGNVPTQVESPITVQGCNGWCAKMKACLDHPQTVVRVATWLGIIGVALGVVGLVLGVLSLLPHQ